jgi:alpha-tubulin suppressor-like RCC1 family protein
VGGACGGGVSENPLATRATPPKPGVTEPQAVGGSRGAARASATAPPEGGPTGSVLIGEADAGSDSDPAPEPTKTANGASCQRDNDCSSNHCAGGLCCDEACDGLCQRCASDGSCTAFPETDETCAPVTCESDSVCRSYRHPIENACSANGACAVCEPVNTRSGIFCGIGAQCDGIGQCQNTGQGLVSAGLSHTCAVTLTGNVRCWGDNELGQLGGAFGQTVVGDDEAPANVPDLEIDFDASVLQISVGGRHACALFEGGGVRCWGATFEPLLELPELLGTTHVALTPDGFVDPLATGNVQLLAPAVQVSVSHNGAHSCALLDTGQLSCWGFNTQAELGYGHEARVEPEVDTPLPTVNLPAPGIAIDVSLGGQHTCAVLEGGGLSCWGAGSRGALGYGDVFQRRAPEALVDVGGPVARASLGRQHTCALLETGALRCWGFNDFAQLGYGHRFSNAEDQTPSDAAEELLSTGLLRLAGDVRLGPGVRIVQVTAFDDSTCALTDRDVVHCWGRNHFGQLGYGHSEPRAEEATNAIALQQELSQAAQVGGLVRALADGGRCALLEDNSLRCWGDHRKGQLGLGNPALGESPSITTTPEDLGPVRYLSDE